MAKSPLWIADMLSLRSLNVSKIEYPASGYLILHLDAGFAEIKPEAGVFYELRALSQKGRLFKPISLYGFQDEQLSFLIKIVGEGTSAFAKLKVGDKVEALGPLGNSFPSFSNRRLLLVSGGVGYPPLAWIKQSASPKDFCFHLHGGASKKDVFECDMSCTEDGSMGYKGYVTDLVPTLLSEHKIDLVFSCGPLPMLSKLAEICADIDLFISMEAYMACGIGVCHGCAIPTFEGYKLVCKDGPIFDAKTILWEEL